MAAKGLLYIWQNEQNFRVQIFIALLVVIAMLFFQVKLAEAVVLFMLMILVLILEVINTIFEKFADILEPRIHSYVQVIKDMMSGAVFISAMGSVIVGFLIFYPYLVALLKKL